MPWSGFAPLIDFKVRLSGAKNELAHAFFAVTCMRIHCGQVWSPNKLAA